MSSAKLTRRKPAAPIVLTEDEQQKVQQALAEIQEAQNMVLAACQELCPVRGFAKEWEKLGDLYDTIKHHWHLVESRRQHFRQEQ